MTGQPGADASPGAPPGQGEAGTTAGTSGQQGETATTDTARVSQRASQRQNDELDFSEAQASASSTGGQGSTAAGTVSSAGSNTAGGRGGGGNPDQPGADGRAGAGGSGTLSHEEQIAVLDRELEGSMGEYDGMILRERRNVLGRSSAESSEEQVDDFDRTLSYYEEGDLSGEESGDNSIPATPGGGDPEVAAAPGNARSGGHPNGSDAGGPGRANDAAYAPPDDIPSGDDDDVVARQIREAAMYEDDPELREKLWEEYRKYKEQT